MKTSFIDNSLNTFNLIKSLTSFREINIDCAIWSKNQGGDSYEWIFKSENFTSDEIDINRFYFHGQLSVGALSDNKIYRAICVKSDCVYIVLSKINFLIKDSIGRTGINKTLYIRISSTELSIHQQIMIALYLLSNKELYKQIYDMPLDEGFTDLYSMIEDFNWQFEEYCSDEKKIYRDGVLQNFLDLKNNKTTVFHSDFKSVEDFIDFSFFLMLSISYIDRTLYILFDSAEESSYDKNNLENSWDILPEQLNSYVKGNINADYKDVPLLIKKLFSKDDNNRCELNPNMPLPLSAPPNSNNDKLDLYVNKVWKYASNITARILPLKEFQDTLSLFFEGNIDIKEISKYVFWSVSMLKEAEDNLPDYVNKKQWLLKIEIIKMMILPILKNSKINCDNLNIDARLDPYYEFMRSCDRI